MMTKRKSQLLVCDCEGSLPLDIKSLGKDLGEDDILSHTDLCRSQIEVMSKAAAGDIPLIVTCTQEAPLFLEIIDDQENPPPVSFVNIRERAGWSDEGKKAGAKIAALIAEAAIDIKPTINLTLNSEGSLLILGRDESAMQAAQRLSERLDVTMVLDESKKKDITPPALMEVPVFTGKISKAEGYMGNFDVAFSALFPYAPSSRGSFAFHSTGQIQTLKADLILDLRDSDPLFNAPSKRDGYFNPSPNDPLKVERALFDLADMVGEFEKPKYVEYDEAICAHERNGISGCTICVDTCSTGAITSSPEKVTIDPYICAGCGSCAGSCPSGAVEYAMPNGVDTLSRLRVLLGTYLKAGGQTPVVLIHDREFGSEAIDIMARHGKGLPAKVLPFVLNEVSQCGLDPLLAAITYGSAQVLVLAPPHNPEEHEGIMRQAALANSILAGLGYGDNRISIVNENDPTAIENLLYALDPEANSSAATFMAMGKKRQRLNQILESLHSSAPAPIDILELEAGAPFGTVNINVEGCTLCLSCVNACPVKALRDNPDAPELRFQESNCIQCGLCKTTCPEKVVTLVPRIDFKAIGAQAIILKQEEPFHCVRCDKPFGVSSTIEKMVEKMSGHKMFQDPKALDRLRMCDDCRVIDMAEGEEHPWASKQRMTKSTDDYLREREELRQQAAEAMERDKTRDN